MAIQLPAPIISEGTLKRGCYSGSNNYYSEIDFSWSRDANSKKGEVYWNGTTRNINTLSGVYPGLPIITGTNVLRIRAIGDGTNYTDSDWTERTFEAVSDYDYYKFRFELSPDATKTGRWILKEVPGAENLAASRPYVFFYNETKTKYYDRATPILNANANITGVWTITPCIDAYGLPQLGNPITLTFPLSSIALYAPETLTTESVTGTTATLNWSSVREATGYLIKYRRASDTAWTQTSTTATTLALAGLTPGTVYNWTATALGNGNNYLDSIESDEVTFETQAAQPLSTPTGLYADNITSDSARIGWNAVENATGYKVEYRRQGDTTWNE